MGVGQRDQQLSHGCCTVQRTTWASGMLASVPAVHKARATERGESSERCRWEPGNRTKNEGKVVFSHLSQQKEDGQVQGKDAQS